MSRCGIPINPLFIESSFICKIITKYNTNKRFVNIKKYIEYQCPYKEKAIYDVYKYLQCIAINNNIPTIIIDDAITYYDKIFKYEQSFRGNNKLGIICASLYISFKINDVPRTAKEIAAIFNTTNKVVIQGCKNAYNIINHIEQNYDFDEKTVFGETKPIHLVERYCDKLGIFDENLTLCKFIALKIDDNHYLQENNAESTVSGIIYYVVLLRNLEITLDDISKITNINDATVKKCFNKIKFYENKLVPNIILSK
jgi:transcription initiation factor TFIIIB Brf1 subunit/transcription initiation factor TFIIB